MKILIITDAWRPQVNGVVRTLEHVAAELEAAGHEISMITPAGFFTLPMPTYPEIRLSLVTSAGIRRRIEAIAPDHTHIATEGPLGIAARKACMKLGRTFTTSYHTRFPEYLRARAPVPLSLTYTWLRRFHNAGAACLVATKSIANDLNERGFSNVTAWTRGVDHALFFPRDRKALQAEFGFKPPVFLNVGRMAIEKNLEAFLELDLPGTKVVVGDGPSRKSLERRFPDVRFLGMLSGEPLAQAYCAADVFVFPSLTDTFGNVLLEALACGVPVAAYPVPGPLDVIDDSGAGVLDNDLGKAALEALDIPSQKALEHAAKFTWDECARIFLEAGNKAA
ncbi:MAG: glycosyltransferase family 1 protein [Salaquimonas sp.]|jgi:glycosyltransferase involved in cell wall biosynthesis|nr:glycosyltransferase family 1 protein [Salaquimonas sp.]